MRERYLGHPRHRERALALAQRGGGLAAFEELIGPLEQVQAEWHTHVRNLKAELSGATLRPAHARTTSTESGSARPSQ